MSKLFKLKKIFKEEQQVRTSSFKLKESIPKSCFNASNKNINSLSGGISFNGGTIKGGKISNGSTTTQQVIVIAKNYSSGYNRKTKTVKTNKEAGAGAAKHLDYINKEDRNEDRSLLSEQFDNVLENEIYSYSNREFSKIDLEKLDKQIEVSVKNGKIENSFSFEDDDKILENKELLKDISKNNKLYIENEKATGKVKIHLKGNEESLELAINKINKTRENKLNTEDIKDIKTNIYNKHGEQLNYRDFNKKKKDLKEKGAKGVLSLEVSPKDNLSSAELKAVVENVIEKMEVALDKNVDWNFTIHTNTEHTHAHIDVINDKGVLNFSKEQLEAFKTLSAESILEVETYSKNQKMEQIRNQELKNELSNDFKFENEEKLNTKIFVSEEYIRKMEENKIMKNILKHDCNIHKGIEDAQSLSLLKKIESHISFDELNTLFHMEKVSKKAEELADKPENAKDRKKLLEFSKETKQTADDAEDRRLKERAREEAKQREQQNQLNQSYKRSYGMSM